MTRAIAVLALLMGLQDAIGNLPLDRLPWWAIPILKGAGTMISVVVGYIRGLYDAPPGTIQVPKQEHPNA